MRQKISIILLILMCLFSIGQAEELISPAILPDTSIELQPVMSVRIFADRKPIMHEGEIVHLTSVLTGFEWCEEIQYQWECDKNDELGFQPVSGATQDHYEFAATIETLSWAWRLVVYYR